MPKAEFIQSAAQVAGQARELFDSGVRTNLLQNLAQIGHPYGLLFDKTQASGLPIFCLEVSLLSSSGSDAKKRGKGPDYKQTLNTIGESMALYTMLNSSIIGAFEWLFNSDLTTGISHRLSAREREVYRPGAIYLGYIPRYEQDTGGNEDNRDYRARSFDMDVKSNNFLLGFAATILLKSSILGSAKSNDNIARKSNLEQLVAAQAVLSPGILKSLSELGERPRNLRVDLNHISLGSSSIHLGTYKGEMPYMIKSPDGSPLAQINPGDALGSVHVSSQANFLRNLSPLEKVDQITQDFVDLLKVIGAEVNPNLSGQQQETIGRAKQATIIGISHLVRLFRRRTGLPTWKLDVLPELIQRFHQHDSQAVSTAFGGTRKVKTSDMEMMVVTPAMRQQLAAAV